MLFKEAQTIFNKKKGTNPNNINDNKTQTKVILNVFKD